MQRGGGLLTAADLAAYTVVERDPLSVSWRGHRLLTNPPPAFGGELVALGLLELEAREDWPASAGSVDHAVALAEAMVATEEARATGTVAGTLARRRATGGTTHISVVDADGNAASMTTSNGEGSGWLLPGTGVMANNMMGEDDLHPGGFHATEPGQRVASMMAPSLVVGPTGDVELVVGSGGSKRIRTALLQVIAGAIDQQRALTDAVESPRLHWDGDPAPRRARLVRRRRGRAGCSVAPHRLAAARPVLRRGARRGVRTSGRGSPPRRRGLHRDSFPSVGRTAYALGAVRAVTPHLARSTPWHCSAARRR